MLASMVANSLVAGRRACPALFALRSPHQHESVKRESNAAASSVAAALAILADSHVQAAPSCNFLCIDQAGFAKGT